MLTAVVGCTWIEAHLGEKLANLSFSRKSICVQQEGTTHGYIEYYRRPALPPACSQRTLCAFLLVEVVMTM